MAKANDFKMNEKVFYYYGDNRAFSYEIINDKGGIKLSKSQYIFGFDIYGRPMNTYQGKFDYILSEYDNNGNFIKNIACTIEDISKDTNFAIDENQSTKL